MTREEMEILTEAGLVKASRLKNLMAEGEEILCIVVSSAKTARTSRVTRQCNTRLNRKS